MATYRFCHALNAAVYSLMMSSCLGMEDGDGIPTGVPTTAAASPEMHTASNTDPTTSVVTVKDSDSPVALAPDFGPAPASGGSGSESATPNREKGVSFKVTEPTPGEIATQTQFESGAITPPKRNSRSHRPSLPLNRLQSYTHLSSFDNVATPLDFAVALRILDVIHMVVPVAALVTGTPMLLAVDRDAGNELVRRPGDGRAGAWVLERKRAIRELVSLVWRRIGDRWGIVEIDELANKVCLVSSSSKMPCKLTQLPSCQGFSFPSRTISHSALPRPRQSAFLLISSRRTSVVYSTHSRRRIILDSKTAVRPRYLVGCAREVKDSPGGDAGG